MLLTVEKRSQPDTFCSCFRGRYPALLSVIRKSARTDSLRVPSPSARVAIFSLEPSLALPLIFDSIKPVCGNDSPYPVHDHNEKRGQRAQL